MEVLQPDMEGLHYISSPPLFELLAFISFLPYPRQMMQCLSFIGMGTENS